MGFLRCGKAADGGNNQLFSDKCGWGTGGGIFRKMYGGFLLEAAELLENSRIRTIGSHFFEIAEEWDIVANELWEVAEEGHSGLLLHISEEIRALHDAEYDLYSQLTKL